MEVQVSGINKAINALECLLFLLPKALSTEHIITNKQKNARHMQVPTGTTKKEPTLSVEQKSTPVG